MSHIGIDFGTTNSALAVAGDDGPPRVATFSLHGEATTTFRSLLYFEEEGEWVGGRPAPWIGPRAIEQYLATDGEGRLMQSMKTFLASRVVKGTTVLGHDFPLERLVALIVEGLWRGASERMGLTRPRTLVAGRPVRFAGSDGDDGDRHAEARLRAALSMAGFDDVELVLEPVAAALHYEGGLARDETVLVADFGGGTSDFCVLRVGPSYRYSGADRERILGTRGVGVAGDDLDARIVRHVVAPALGAGTMYRSQMGNVLEIPPGIFDKLERWNELSFLKSRRNIDMLLGYLRTAREPDRIRALIHLVEHNLGHRLYRTVEAAKVRLSSADEATIELVDGPLVVRGRLTRADFERWIAPELDALARCVDALLADVGLASDAIDTVFLTGGTGQVPAVRRLFAERFGEERLRTGDFLTSIASGLALHARRRARAGVP
ncbi:MAG: Hsp70 family protein [Deltaproteobacteria bacterium]|nr:Hsp70 family protein [Deltaproteobacteria bacterium]